jgi:isocitrate/isopropylmalate dehydrogenase
MNASITVLGGDGIGPEVTAEGVRCLQAIGQRFGHEFTLTEQPFGGAAIDLTGEPLPRSTLDSCLAADAILLGAIGGPAWSAPDAKVRPETGLLGLRKALGNLRESAARDHPSGATRDIHAARGSARWRRSDVRARTHRRYLLWRQDP